MRIYRWHDSQQPDAASCAAEDMVSDNADHLGSIDVLLKCSSQRTTALCHTFLSRDVRGVDICGDALHPRIVSVSTLTLRSHIPCIFYRWYKPGELGKRSGIFTSSGLIGTLFSGVLQAAVYQNLNGVDGRSGWRWLFIIDGIITLPIALYGFFVFPDVPATTRAFYLKDEERLLAYERLDSDTVHHKLSWNLFKRVLSRWRWYGFSLLFGISGEVESFGSNNLMGQWLSVIGGFTVEQVDYYPSGVTAFGIVSTLVCATWTDYTRARWPVLVYMCVCCAIAAVCILVWSSPIGLKFFAYYLSGAAYAGQATTFAWANQVCAGDDQERAVVLASMNMWNNAVNAWWPLLFYAAPDAPRFKKGMITMICTCAATLAVTWLVWYLERRERHRAVRVEGDARQEEKSQDSSAAS